MFLAIIVILVVVATITWFIGMHYVNDATLSQANLGKFKRVLVVFPHPDDETNIAGTLLRLHQLHAHITLLVLTTGECGTPDAHMEPALKAIRSREMIHVATLLGIDHLIQKDIGDGQVAHKRTEARISIVNAITASKPDLVITYDLAGLYGHQDHIACAEETLQCLQAGKSTATIWYSAAPKRLLDMTNLPTHMAKDPEFAKKRAKPNLRVSIGLAGTIAKIHSIYAHKSQRRSFRESTPYRAPIWFIYSMRTNEYFEELR